MSYDYSSSSWGDLLTSYWGNSITYDGVGNPLTWGDYGELTWQGRRLMSYSDSESGDNYSYTYNADGIRTSKTVNGVKHIYHLSGTQILSEEWTEDRVQHILIFVYDASGQPIGMSHFEDGVKNGDYLFAKNVQGDITAVYDANGTCLVTYTYDAWGNTRVRYSDGGASTAARYNPLRYRGYYYDIETGFYYVSSRYYDPEVGRWINADNQIAGVGGEVLGYNMFAYCMNNPVNMSDPSGNWPRWATIALGAVAAVAAVAVTVVTLGAAAPAAACTLTTVGMSIGASYAVARASNATFVSSDAFRRFLPESEKNKIFTSHNLLTDSLAHRDEKEKYGVPSDKIRIAFWGFIRHEEINREIIRKLSNDKRFELHYYGREQQIAQNLKAYVAQVRAENVFFHGEYNPEDRYLFVRSTDLIHNIYKDSNTMLAIGNKYYDGLIFYIPQLCMRGSFMGEKCTENGVGFECDPFDDDFSDAIYNYFGKIESLSFRRSCDKELEKVMKEFDEGKKLCRAIFTK